MSRRTRVWVNVEHGLTRLCMHAPISSHDTIMPPQPPFTSFFVASNGSACHQELVDFVTHLELLLLFS